jgi:hypothetical protein
MLTTLVVACTSNDESTAPSEMVASSPTPTGTASDPLPTPPSTQPAETPTTPTTSTDVIQLVIEPTDEVRIAPLDLDYPWERRGAATLIYDVGSGELYLLEAGDQIAQVSPFAPIAITQGFRETPSYLVDLATLEVFRIEPLRIQVAYWLDEHRFVSVSETPGVPDGPYVVDLERREAILRPTPWRFVPVSEEALADGSRLIADASRPGISIVAPDGSIVDHLLADDISLAHGRDVFVGRRPGGELVLARGPDWDLQTLALTVGKVSSSVDWLEDDSAIVVSALEGTYLVDLRTLGSIKLADEPWTRLKVAGRLVLFDTGTFGEPMVAQVYDLDAGELVASFFDRNWLAPNSDHEFVLARGGFCSGTDEFFTLYVFDVESRQLRRLAPGADVFIYASWAPEGELIAAGNGGGGFWIFNARTGEETRFAEAAGLPPDLILRPQWAVGGNRIVLNRGGGHGICD